MKPVRRRIRRHFGLTAKQVAVRSKRPWYLQWCITGLYVLAGYLIAYWQFSASHDMQNRLQQTALENQNLHTKIIQVERQLQIEKAAQTNLANELNAVQDENMHIKEDLLFYKNMLNSKK